MRYRVTIPGTVLDRTNRVANAFRTHIERIVEELQRLSGTGIAGRGTDSLGSLLDRSLGREACKSHAKSRSGVPNETVKPVIRLIRYVDDLYFFGLGWDYEVLRYCFS